MKIVEPPTLAKLAYQTVQRLQTNRTYQIMLASCVSYLVSTCGIKVSVLFFYKRVVRGKISSTYTWIMQAAIGVQVLFLASCLGTVCTSCRPVRAYWLREDPAWAATHEYTCLNGQDALFSMAVISVVQDLVATFLPFHLISQLQLPRRQKIALYVTFMGGSYSPVDSVSLRQY